MSYNLDFADLLIAAEQVHTLREAYVNAGFTREEAMELIKASLQGQASAAQGR